MCEGFDSPRHECGVFGIYGDGSVDPAEAVYLGLFALQHRGQESCGIAVNDCGVIRARKAMGLVGDVFSEETLADLTGQMAIGHVRYSTAGGSNVSNAQPLVMRYAKGRFAIAHNGNLTNNRQIENELARDGAIFQTSTDSEVIAHLIARERLYAGSIERAVVKAVERLRGAFSLIVMSPQKLVAARDSMGFRPLCIGKLRNSYVFSSETCALDVIGAEFVRDMLPGEVVMVDANGLHIVREGDRSQRRICIFEYIYFARPDSCIDGIDVHDARLRAGRLLARRSPADADLVIGVPDSGLDAALGFSRESGIPYGVGFVRNNYVGRTFIKPRQSQRVSSVKIKLNVIKENIAGKRVVMVDDSIVRGTTCGQIVTLLKSAGAKEVHVRISAPTIKWPCYFGTDIPSYDELTANHFTLEEMREQMNADSLAFLNAEDLCSLINEQDCARKSFCDACFTGDYPIPESEILGTE